jgi:hypothetical protein
LYQQYDPGSLLQQYGPMSLLQQRDERRHRQGRLGRVHKVLFACAEAQRTPYSDNFTMQLNSDTLNLSVLLICMSLFVNDLDHYLWNSFSYVTDAVESRKDSKMQWNIFVFCCAAPPLKWLNLEHHYQQKNSLMSNSMSRWSTILEPIKRLYKKWMISIKVSALIESLPVAYVHNSAVTSCSFPS